MSLGDISSLAVNFMGKIFWSNSEYGKVSGALVSASADTPSEKSVKTESKLFDQISNIYYKNELLFFTAPISTTPDTLKTDTAIFFKAVPKTGETTKETNLVSDDFQ